MSGTTRTIQPACVLALMLGLAPSAYAQTPASVTGTVTDAQDHQPLAGASVVLRVPGTTGIAAGTATGPEGDYRITDVEPGRYTLTVSFIGYTPQELTVELAAGEEETVGAALAPGGFDLNAVVVTGTPGGTPQKALDMPASSSVLTPREIMDEVTPSSVGALRNTTGVDMVQTGVDRQEVVLRGFNNAFSGATYVLTDYRQAAVPSLGVNVFSIMPNMPIDLERIEVVRGPASALYGAGVDAGVIHFITKDPFTYPGTTVAAMGGERSFFGFQGRQAGVLGSRLGYKITGAYSQAEDWAFDPAQTAGFAVEREDNFQKVNVNGMLQYRFGEQTSLTAQAGYSSLTATVLSGIGTLQADGFGYTYGQLRLQAGGFFAQAYVNRNDAGDSFVYGSGDEVVDYGMLYNAQAQYDGRLGARQQLILGVDAELTRPDTDGTILGRNEDDDDITQVGAYVQSTTNLSSRLDLTLALRADYDNVVEAVGLSPRAAVVFKPSPMQTLRATYNRAFASPGTNSLFLDIVAREPDEQLPFRIRARGAAEGFAFEREAGFGALAGTDLVASGLAGCFPVPTDVCGAPQPVGLPLSAVYAQVYASIANTPVQNLTQALNAAGWPVDEQTTAGLVALLSPAVGTDVQGFSEGALALLNPSATRPEDRFRPISEVSDIAALEQTISQTIEVGYKGLFSDRLLFTADAYYATKENFIRGLAMETPFVFVPELASDLEAALAEGISGNPQLAGVLQQMGVSPEQAAMLITGLAGGSLPDATTPVAVVQPKEHATGPGQVPELLLTYRNFGRIQYYGVDLNAQFMLSERADVFGNFSWVSDDSFDNEELDEENVDLAVALNAPRRKAKAGASYRVPGGFSASLSGRYTEGFPVRSGPYVGEVESYFLLDVGGGYDFSRHVPGLQLTLTVQNVLGNDHREFVGAPQIGRMALARLTYAL